MTLLNYDSEKVGLENRLRIFSLIGLFPTYSIKHQKSRKIATIFSFFLLNCKLKDNEAIRGKILRPFFRLTFSESYKKKNEVGSSKLWVTLSLLNVTRSKFGLFIITLIQYAK